MRECKSDYECCSNYKLILQHTPQKNCSHSDDVNDRSRYLEETPPQDRVPQRCDCEIENACKEDTIENTPIQIATIDDDNHIFISLFRSPRNLKEAKNVLLYNISYRSEEARKYDKYFRRKYSKTHVVIITQLATKQKKGCSNYYVIIIVIRVIERKIYYCITIVSLCVCDGWMDRVKIFICRTNRIRDIYYIYKYKGRNI
ncbi:hypothetical protein, no similarity [Maudiozyma barnettii]|uniref:Uncharacterized protein n=1 Tax=Maudiozyma barnettii TaxID=61262 RepID=A0A8H2VFF5_9SACH|nr:hypothetical protein, no similarity [Kazachstania barnettii]CAB4254485.1 hypothetical protein, no similarity [Kazachstania barnettii]CAD1782481.1 hypothetical protein, no similarity [Kazachstania barnettii]